MLDFPLWVRQNHLVIIIDDLAAIQGYLITAALQMRHDFQRPSSFIIGTPVLTADPFVNNVQAWWERSQAATDALEAVQDLIEDAEE